jgi:FMN phosphatase YigB (HAD superfamily)
MIFVDLDNTLIDSIRRSEDEIKILLKYGIPKDTCYKIQTETFVKHGRYSYELLYQELLAIKTDLSRKIIKDLDKLLKRNYLFYDSYKFFLEYEREELAVLTFGDSEFQMRKIKSSNVDLFIDKIYVTQHKDDFIFSYTVKHPDESVFFIDDSPHEIEAVKKACSKATCIQLRILPPWVKQVYTIYADSRQPSFLEAISYINLIRTLDENWKEHLKTPTP